MRKLLIIIFVSISATLMAQTQDTTYVNVALAKPRSYFGVALGVNASTNGLGVNAVAALTKRIALRLGYETVNMPFNNAFTYQVGGQTFNVRPTWKSGGLSAIVDFYLLKSFYISGGLVLSDMNISTNLKSANAIKFGDIVFTPDELGELGLSVKALNKLAPYGAIGFGRNISRNHRLTTSLELGAYYMGSYVVELSGTGLYAANNDPANQASLNQLNTTLKSLSWSGIYPIIKFGISYKFFGQNK